MLSPAGSSRIGGLGPRYRKPPTVERGTINEDYDEEHECSTTSFNYPGNRSVIERYMETPRVSRIVIVVLTVLAFAVRFTKLKHPDEVVFDEAHFGLFASYYLRREYFFDVHPPLAKLLVALAAWFAGFKGDFDFTNIGNSYTANKIPYWGMRALPATLGSLTVPVVYHIMHESGYPTIVAAFSAIVILFDNAHVAHSRLILLDAILIFFMSLTIYSYIKFRKHRYHEFTFDWWAWMLATGFFMACTWSSKVNGILTVISIGIAVMVDLWGLFRWKKSDNERIAKHFLARVIGFIVVPFVFYLLFFWIHFAILTHSGEDDGLMTPAFQRTLISNKLLMNGHEIHYFDTITIKHVKTKYLLHLHSERYPDDHPDRRISCQGQQVTSYPHEDENNNWIIVPTKALPKTGRGRNVHHNDVIRLLHAETGTFLTTHDVTLPGHTGHTELITFPNDQMHRYNETLFHLRLIDGYGGQVLTTKADCFKLQHVATAAYMTLSGHALPYRAFNQREADGHPAESSHIWVGDTIVAGEDPDELDERLGNRKDRKPKSMNFFSKFIQIQTLAFSYNAGLTESHPYQSSPSSWPFVKNGISFWMQDKGQKQIYLVGNVVGWWTTAGAVFLAFGVFTAVIIAKRRKTPILSESVTSRLWNSCGFFVMIWAVHYAPFFFFSRQLFLHHYLPAHLASALVAGAVLNLICTETINYPISCRGVGTPPKLREYADLSVKGAVIVGIFTVAQLSVFIFMTPLTYGTPGLDSEAIDRRRLRRSWKLHFDLGDD